MREAYVFNPLRDQLNIRADRNKLIDILHRNLVELGIQSGYMALFSQYEGIRFARMVLAYSGEERYVLPENGLEFTSVDLIPDVFFNDHERFSFMVEALYFDERQVGFVILDMSRHINSIHAGIRRIVSNIFRSVHLVQKIKQQKMKQEKERKGPGRFNLAS